MTKPEPLTKEKIFRIGLIEDVYGIKEVKRLDYEDVKSAVNWLLKEIEKREKELEDWHSAKSSGVSFLGVKDGWEYRNALRWVKDLIKKAFKGVVE